ncbi:MAG: cobalamin-dependent protein [Candidatus Omnitrophica bacterium]|nr:cobalamin-dependent protein [Candidatus Omnitrophota bacterium]
MLETLKKRYRFRMIAPVYPAFNIYSNIASCTTALGPVYVATNVNKMARWDAEVIDENNLRQHGPRSKDCGADHEFLQQQRPADVVGFYGGLTSTIPCLYKVAQFYKDKGVVTIAGGQHFVEDHIMDALSHGIDYIVIGEGEETIQELLEAIEGKREILGVKGIAFLRNGEFIRMHEREPLLDFDKLPLPDFSLVRYARLKVYPVERIRGCGMECEFCTVKGKPRAACPERLLEQIRLLVETRAARHFFIIDDLFGQHRTETVQLCYELRNYQKRIGTRLDFTA